MRARRFLSETKAEDDQYEHRFRIVNPALHALIRFWWLVVAGLILAIVAGALVYQAKDDKQYEATTKLFVNSAAAPYLRTQQLQVTPQGPTSRIVRGTKGKTGSTPSKTVQVPSAPTIQAQAPDTAPLLDAANLYPQFIMSDQVAQMSPAPRGCKLNASGIFASTNAFGVFKASPIPVVEVVARCDGTDIAMAASKARAAAFQKWVVREQNAAKIPQRQRVLVSTLDLADSAKTVGSTSAALPVFIGLVVLFAFCGIAVLLDRPRPAAVPATASQAKA